jgi:hypothetical protein
VDKVGNAYAIGFFQSDSITFGSTTLFNIAIPYTSLFVVKYSSNGNVLWAKSAGGDYYIEPISIAADNLGNIYVAGYFKGDSITFGSIKLINKDTGNTGDIFIAKYDTSGNIIWAKSAGGDYDDYANSIAADAFGNIYVAGNFASDSIIFGPDTLTLGGMFVAKYDNNGNALWAKRANHSYYGYIAATSVAIDYASNNIYVVGTFDNDSISFDSFTLHNNGSGDIFTVKYDTSGNVIWAKRAGGNNDDGATSVVVDKSGNCCVLGQFHSNAISFGTEVLVNTYPGAADLFVVKYDSLGNTLWAKNADGMGNEYPRSIAADTSGNVYIDGYYAEFPLTFGTYTLPYLGYADIFLAKYDYNGNVLWAKSVATSADERSYSIAVNTSNNVYMVGTFNSDSISFGTNILSSTNGSTDMFIAKLDAFAGIDEIANEENNINVFPNPTDGVFTIRQPADGKLQPAIYIYNSLGKLVYQKERATQNSEQIDLSAYSKGIYFVKMQSAEKSYSKKVILE